LDWLWSLFYYNAHYQLGDGVALSRIIVFFLILMTTLIGQEEKKQFPLFKMPRWMMPKPDSPSLPDIKSIDFSPDTVVVTKEIKADTVFFTDTLVLTDTVRIEYRINAKNERKKIIHGKGYFLEWDPLEIELKNQKDLEELREKAYFQVQLNKDKRIKRVTYYNKEHQAQYSWEFMWSKDGSRHAYSILFHQNMRMTDLDSTLFTDALSEVRVNWTAQYKHRKNGKLASLLVYDHIGFLSYQYQFAYLGEKGEDERIHSSYFRSDSSKVGNHIIYYNENQMLEKIDYFGKNGNLKRSITMDYWPGKSEVQKTIRDSIGIILSRRIIPWK
jgi:hypothetical protein